MFEFLREPAQADLARQTHLDLISARGAGQWLHTIPTKALHKDVDPLTFKTQIQRQLRVPIFDSEFFCPLCDGVVDVFGDHCLVCSGGGDRTKRHNLLRNECHRLCRAAGLNSELEKQDLLLPRPLLGALPENGIASESARRPADVFVHRWHRGVPACLDFAVSSGLRSNLLARPASDSLLFLTEYEDFKCAHLDTKRHCEREGMTFVPMIVDAVGGSWGPQAHKVWASLAKSMALSTGELEQTTTSRIYQSMGLILHRENARAVLRRAAPAVTLQY